MTCPQCGAEYPAGTTRCRECGIDLMEQTAVDSQEEADWRADVVVLETRDESQLLVARSLLEAEGIPCFAKGEEGQQLMALGPARLCVSLEDEAAARALLAHLEPAEPGEE